MANSKSAKKSYEQADRRRVVNLRRLRAMKSTMKAVRSFVTSKDISAATEALPKAFQAIDKALKRGIIKKNNAARKKSGLAKAIETVSK